MMESTDYPTYLILAILLILWCVLHSAMISITVTEYVEKRLGSNYRFYRVFFNLISILTLIPVVIFAYSAQTPAIFQWTGYMRIGQVLILGLAVWFFFLGGRHYDIRQLIGLKQIREGTADMAITDMGKLDTSGVLGITRHPWYLATLLIIWARQMDVSAIIVNVILTVYLIVGTHLEERKLVREFGEKYRAYQREVSMLIPYKWLKSKIINRHGPDKTDRKSDDLVCYCFGYTVNDIEQDFIHNGQSLIMDRIAMEKKAGGCDCARKNPKGR